jgi:hypothetical protein
MNHQTRFSFYSCLMVVVLAVFGCASDEPAVAVPTGTWNITSSNVNFSINNEPMYQYLIRGLDWDNDEVLQMEKQLKANLQVELTGLIELSPDNTYVSNIVKNSGRGDWKLSSDRKALVFSPHQLAPVHLDFEVVTLESGKCTLKYIQYVVLDEYNPLIREEVTFILTQ